MAKREPLGVYLYGRRVAELTTNGRPSNITLRYTAAALDMADRNTPLLSCSMPLTDKKIDAANYFRGMLPEGQHLQSLAAKAKVPTYDIFGLLARYGRDVAGAAVISADDPEQRPGDAVPYTEQQLADEVAGLDDRPLAIYDDSELSIPGLQNKLLLIRTKEGWARPAGGRPSTHILKVEDRRYPGMARMEAACMQLARAIGLTTADAKVKTFDGIDCIIVSRFDRIVDDDGIVRRVHQEDSCQALDRNPELHENKAKYERWGGPSLAEIAGLLDVYAADSLRELERLLSAATFTVIIGNADAHGKNVSVLHRSPGVVELSPVYDTVPTVMWPKLPSTAAMTVNGAFDLGAITIDDLIAEAARWPMSTDAAERYVNQTVEAIVANLDILPDKLAALVQRRVRHFTKGRRR